jgi:hypothetical protein
MALENTVGNVINDIIYIIFEDNGHIYRLLILV